MRVQRYHFLFESPNLDISHSISFVYNFGINLHNSVIAGSLIIIHTGCIHIEGHYRFITTYNIVNHHIPHILLHQKTGIGMTHKHYNKGRANHQKCSIQTNHCRKAKRKNPNLNPHHLLNGL